MVLMYRSILTCAILLFALLQCTSGSTRNAPSTREQFNILEIELPSIHDKNPHHYRGLEQVVAYKDGLYSGGRPQGEEGLESIRKLGVRTIICVDGAVPNVAGAKALGMRYIHLPIKYDAPSNTRIIELAVATELGMQRGPTYIHCHHGKHRSATAAALAVIALGWSDSSTMLARLSVSGTSIHYEGLWNAVANARFINAEERNAVVHDFPSIVYPSGMVESMIAAETAIANLKAIKNAGWVTPQYHPDLVPAAEAGALVEIFRHLQADVSIKTYPEEFATDLRRTWSSASDLEHAILQEIAATDEILSTTFKTVIASCNHCHQIFRK